ncbi:MAG: hypothetical protein SFU99_10325 [Saprospiraceae bacterium]|nr:hypothetical protein [Saprospiraceae bacterium]
MPLPKILAGPILRRVEKDKISVWLCLSGDYFARVKLQIYDKDNVTSDNRNGAEGLVGTDFTTIPTSTNIAQMVRFGKRLYLTVITAKIQSQLDQFKPGKVYSYNIVFEEFNDSPTSLDLRTEGFLKKVEPNTAGEIPNVPLGYGENRLPTFVLPSDDPKKLIIAQGSCRKMHGIGKDGLVALDGIIKKSLSVAADSTENTRPQQLYLTGDQIYADEVPAIALHYAGIIGDNEKLVEEHGAEKVKITKTNGDTIELRAATSELPVLMRQYLLNKFASFTSDAASSHLISFQEFCGLYLNYWNLRSWNNTFRQKIAEISKDFSEDKKDDAKTKIENWANAFLESDPNLIQNIRGISAAAKDLVFNEELNGIFGADADDDKLNEWKKKTKFELKKEIQALVNFYDKLPQVSRVLANVPTYMIFDDHEITDDWNITQRWKNLVLSKPLGRDVIRNGLMAYAIFQDWGNTPAEYIPQEFEEVGGEIPEAQQTPKTRFIRLIKEYARRVADNSDLSNIRAQVIEPIENLLGMGSNPSPIKWYYDVPAGPTRTYVLDTRTQREYESLNTPPGLISAASLLQQTPNTIPGGNTPFTIVVSPAPVLGLSSFEELIQPAAAAVFGLSSSSTDNPGIIGGLLKFDYEAWGFNVAAFERFLARLNTYKKVILLSGDVHYGFSSVMDYWKDNSSTPTSRIMQLTSSSLKNMWLENIEIFKSGFVQKLLAGFDGRLEKVGWNNKNLSTTGNISARNRTRLRKNPAVVPLAGWDPGATVSEPPDFRWRISVVSDQNAPEHDPLSMDINLADPNSLKDGYKKIVKRHQQFFEERVGRRLMWPAHVTLIKVEADPANSSKLILKHEFYMQPEIDPNTDEEKNPKARIVHVIPLDATDTELDAPLL